MKAILFCAALCLSAFGQGTGFVVVPNGLENREGDTSAASLFGGGPQSRSHLIFGSQNFGLFPAGGAYITELRLRLDGQHPAFSGTADIEIHMSTTGAIPDSQGVYRMDRTGPDETVVLPRSTIQLTGTATTPSGPNSFSVVIPLPSRFLYNPANGNLLVDARVYNESGLQNLDWDSSPNDHASAAVGTLTGTFANTVTSSAPITQFSYVLVPEPRAMWLIIVGIMPVIFRRRRNVLT
jgi:hypothetical protein